MSYYLNFIIFLIKIAFFPFCAITKTSLKPSYYGRCNIFTAHLILLS